MLREHRRAAGGAPRRRARAPRRGGFASGGLRARASCGRARLAAPRPDFRAAVDRARPGGRRSSFAGSSRALCLSWRRILQSRVVLCRRRARHADSSILARCSATLSPRRARLGPRRRARVRAGERLAAWNDPEMQGEERRSACETRHRHCDADYASSGVTRQENVAAAPQPGITESAAANYGLWLQGASSESSTNGSVREVDRARRSRGASRASTSPARSARQSLMPVLARVCASTVLTMTAQ